MWKAANTLLVSGIASLALGVVIAALLGYVITREIVGDFPALQITLSLGISMAGIVLGGGLLMTVTGLALMWTTKWDDADEEWSESEEIEDE